jgi:hypothetical protein
MLNVDINSPSYIIRLGIVERLKAIPTFQAVKRWSVAPMHRVQAKWEDSQIPYVGCYELDEALGPDGDPNHCEPRFVHSLRVGFTVIIAANDEEVAEQNLDSAYWMILNLLTNPRWARFPAAGNWNLGQPIVIEGVQKGAQKKTFGNKTLDNETPIAELQMELTLVHRTDFPPWPFDDLARIHVTVAYPWPYNPNAEEPFTVEYDLPIQGEFTVNDYTLFHLSFAQPVLGGLPIAVSSYALASPSFATPTLS